MITVTIAEESKYADHVTWTAPTSYAVWDLISADAVAHQRSAEHPFCSNTELDVAVADLLDVPVSKVTVTKDDIMPEATHIARLIMGGEYDHYHIFPLGANTVEDVPLMTVGGIKACEAEGPYLTELAAEGWAEIGDSLTSDESFVVAFKPVNTDH